MEKEAVATSLQSWNFVDIPIKSGVLKNNETSFSRLEVNSKPEIKIHTLALVVPRVGLQVTLFIVSILSTFFFFFLDVCRLTSTIAVASHGDVLHLVVDLLNL